MALARLAVRNLRIIQAADVRLSPSFNLVFGENAAGKTSLLEAVYFLSTGRSFRTSRVGDLTRAGTGEIMVRGELVDEQGDRMRVGIARSAAGVEARVGGNRARAISELAEVLPVVAVYPEGQDLVTGGPRQRRSLVDWGLFHGRADFAGLRGRYIRALRQRNALLRSGGRAGAFSAWEDELAKAGDNIDRRREAYVESLGRAVEDLVPGLAIGLRYRKGWGGSEGYREVLERSRGRDRGQGYTQLGPHRADMVIEVDGLPAGRVISRGQQKVLVAALRVGQVAVLAREGGKRSVVLVDDLASELDEQARVGLLDMLKRLGAQLIVTAIDRSGVPRVDWQDKRVFHVEHGQVRELI